MKMRRVVATVEMDTAQPLAGVKSFLKSGTLPVDVIVRQVQVNLIRPATKKKK